MVKKDAKKKKDKTPETKETTHGTEQLDGKALHDLYRHTTKLIK